MIKKIIGLLFFLLYFGAFAQNNSGCDVYLIGDAGEDTISGKALLLLKEQLLANPNSAVLFLGDNVYPSGLKPNKKSSVMRLESQLQILNEYKGQVYFIPGNHDWQAQGVKGLKTLAHEQSYIENYLKNKTIVSNRNDATFLPKDGLPGPETVMLNDKLRLILIDTQWFLHQYKKNKIYSIKNTKQLFYKRLDSLLQVAKANNEQVIIAAHHPMFSNGHHGASKQPLRFLVNKTPFQIFGLLGLNRLLSQDIPQPRYGKMRKKMLYLFDGYDNIVFASGHDHNLQCFKDKANRYIVSGAGSKLTQLQKKQKFPSVFQDDSKTGFIKLHYTLKSVQTTIYRVGEKELIVDGF